MELKLILKRFKLSRVEGSDESIANVVLTLRLDK